MACSPSVNSCVSFTLVHGVGKIYLTEGNDEHARYLNYCNRMITRVDNHESLPRLWQRFVLNFVLQRQTSR